MFRRRFVVIAVVLVVLAVLALSASSVLADSRPTHPPACNRVQTYVPDGSIILECHDAGNDIVAVAVKTSMKYDLTWSNTRVRLQVYPANFTDRAFYIVKDKAGSVTTGSLP